MIKKIEESFSFRITILDFLAVFLPGTVWLILMITLFKLIQTIAYTPIDVWNYIIFSKFITSWITIFPLIILSLLIGYILQSVIISEYLEYISMPLFVLDKDKRNLWHCLKWKGLKFPFNRLFEREYYYYKVKKILKSKIEIYVDNLNLPGKQPFSTAKRYLRLISPSLYEESERLEAEVRMIGSLFLASIFSFIESILNLGIYYKINFEINFLSVGWMILSLFLIVFLGKGFNDIRMREVKYTYLNLLITECTDQRILDN